MIIRAENYYTTLRHPGLIGYTTRRIRYFGAYGKRIVVDAEDVIATTGVLQDDLLALRAFLYAFPTESPPILGQQVTLTDGNRSEAIARIDLLIARGQVDTPVPECDLVVKGVINGAARGWAMNRNGQFQSDRAAEPAIDRAALEAQITGPGQYLTFTCTPWGSGVRIGIDRDFDGVLDGDE